MIKEKKRFLIFIVILGLFNAIISSNALRIFVNNNNYFNDEITIVTIFYFISILSSIFVFIINKVLKITFVIFLNSLISFYICTYAVLLLNPSFFNSIILYSIFLISGNIYYLLTTNKKLFYNFFLKVGILIGISTIIVDLSFVWSYVNSYNTDNTHIKLKNTINDTLVESKNYEVSKNKPHNIFYVVFDEISSSIFLDKLSYNNKIFFKTINDGIFFNNAYSNGHHTAISLSQHLNGRLKDYTNPHYHKILQQHKIKSNYYIYQRKCTEASPLNCFGLLEYIRSNGNISEKVFFTKKMVFAIGEKLKLPLYYFFNLFNKGKELKVSINLVNTQLEQIKTNLNPNIRDTFNFIYFLPPHSPFIYDENCILKGDLSSLSKANDNFDANQNDYIDQIHCVNKIMIKLIDILKEKKLYDSSTIIFTSDHGLLGVNTAFKEKNIVNSVTFENLHKIKKHQEFFNEVANDRSRIPLWIKPAFYKKSLTFNEKKIISLDLPVTVLESMGIKDAQMYGLNILDDKIDNFKFNNRIPITVMYGQYGKGTFLPFTFLALKEKNWTIIPKEEAHDLEKNKFAIR